MRKKQNLWLLIILVGGILGCSTHSNSVARNPNDTPLFDPNAISAELGVEEKNGHVLATLTFKNPPCTKEQCAKMVYLDPSKACLGKAESFGEVPIHYLFTITSEDGSLIPFLTLNSSNSKQTQGFSQSATLVPLEAGDTITTEIALDQTYVFLPGTHAYKIRYQALSGIIVSENDPNDKRVFVLTSNEASIILTRSY